MHSRVYSKFILYAFIIIVSLYISLLNYNQDLNMLDEGFVLNSMLRVLHGEVPYRDFFSLITPGQFFIGAIIIKLFGSPIVTERIVTGIFSALFSIIIFLIIKTITKSVGFSILGWIFSLSYGLSLFQLLTSYSWNAMFLGASSILFTLRFCEKNNKWDASLIGLFIGLSILFKQSIGVYFIFAILMAVGISFILRSGISLKYSVFAVVTFSSVISCYMLYLFLTGSFRDWFKFTLLFPLTVFNDAKLPPPSIVHLDDILHSYQLLNLTPYIFYFQVVVLACASFCLINDIIRKRCSISFLILYCATVCSFLHNFERFSFLKTRTTLMIGISLFIYLLWRLWNESTRNLHRIVVVLSVILVMFSCSIAWDLRMRYFSNENTPFPNTSILVSKSMSDKYSLFYQQINQVVPKDASIFIYPLTPMSYVLLNHANPTRYDNVIPGNFDAEGLEEIINVLKNKHIQYLIKDEFYYVDGNKFSEYAPQLNDFIEKHYHTIYELNKDTAILEINN